MEYKSFSDPTKGKCSGWYIFRSENDCGANDFEENSETIIFDGPLVTEIRQKYSTNRQQRIRLYKMGQEEIVEFQYTLGKLNENQEIISRIFTSIESEGKMSVDSQGYHYETYYFNNNASLLIPGNYYPMSVQAHIEDSERKLVILTNTPHGVASLGKNFLSFLFLSFLFLSFLFLSFPF
jgi:hypothetical protein